MTEEKGLYWKYRVEKADGRVIDDGAKYFVLRIDTDPHARVALKAYAESVSTENPELSKDLEDWLKCLSENCQK